MYVLERGTIASSSQNCTKENKPECLQITKIKEVKYHNENTIHNNKDYILAKLQEKKHKIKAYHMFKKIERELDNTRLKYLIKEIEKYRQSICK